MTLNLNYFTDRQTLMNGPYSHYTTARINNNEFLTLSAQTGVPSLPMFIGNTFYTLHECERGFSLMNVILTKLRTSLTIEHLSSLMFVNMNGPPIAKFEPRKYVRSWLTNHRTADDTRSKRVVRDIEQDEKFH